MENISKRKEMRQRTRREKDRRRSTVLPQWSSSAGREAVQRPSASTGPPRQVLHYHYYRSLAQVFPSPAGHHALLSTGGRPKCSALLPGHYSLLLIGNWPGFESLWISGRPKFTVIDWRPKCSVSPPGHHDETLLFHAVLPFSHFQLVFCVFRFCCSLAFTFSVVLLLLFCFFLALCSFFFISCLVLFSVIFC